MTRFYSFCSSSLYLRYVSSTGSASHTCRLDLSICKRGDDPSFAFDLDSEVAYHAEMTKPVLIGLRALTLVVRRYGRCGV